MSGTSRCRGADHIFQCPDILRFQHCFWNVRLSGSNCRRGAYPAGGGVSSAIADIACLSKGHEAGETTHTDHRWIIGSAIASANQSGKYSAPPAVVSSGVTSALWRYRSSPAWLRRREVFGMARDNFPVMWPARTPPS